MGKIVRHKTTGGLYEVLFRGAMVESNVLLADYAEAVVCQRLSDGGIVVRPGRLPLPTTRIALYAASVRTTAPLTNGDEVGVYRGQDGDPRVWVCPTIHMDDGRFEPAEAPQAPSSTPGEVERLVEQAIKAARKTQMMRHTHCEDPQAVADAEAVENIARTALLSHISTAARAEGAGDGLCAGRRVCEALGFDPINHHNALRCPYCNPRGMVLVLPAVPKQESDDEAQPRLEAAERAYREAFDAYASPHLTALRHRVAMRAALSAADATTPTDRSA